MSEKTQDLRIDEALKLLNEVAGEKGAELQDLVSEKYGELKSALGGFAEKAGQETHAAYEQGAEKVKDLAADPGYPSRALAQVAGLCASASGRTSFGGWSVRRSGLPWQRSGSRERLPT